MEFDGVSVGVAGPGLPRQIGAKFGVGYLDAAGAELGDGGGEVVDLEADVSVGAFRAVLGVAEEELKEGAAAGLEVVLVWRNSFLINVFMFTPP